MRIHFHKISVQNFMSVGNTPLVMEFDKAQTTLIIGENGAGKSLFINALMFALYGRGFRGRTKKEDLVNWIVGQDCRVELELSVNTTPYKIVRCIKPDVFEIWNNGQKLPATKVAEQQARLENEILRCGPKTLQQICVLGKANYTPFMQLDAAGRRAVIEEIMDVAVFSRMAEHLKPMVGSVKADRTAAQGEVKLAEDKLRFVDEQAAKMMKSVDDDIARCEDTILKLKADIERIEIPEAPSDDEKAKLRKAQNAALVKRADLESEIRNLKNQIARISEWESHRGTCPSCGQPISQEHCDAEVARIEQEIAMKQSDLDKHAKAEAKIEEAAKKLSDRQSLHNKALMGRQAVEAEVKLQERTIERLRKQTPAESVDRKPYVDDYEKAKKKFNQIDKTFDLMAAANRLLKDDGIKAAVVRRYLPRLNNELNKLIQHFGLNVSFKFNETFDESIRSRFIHDAPFDAFSQGQQQRMELALLFTWRKIAAEKASLDTNILIMDEILDGSLDAKGKRELLKLVQQLSSGNTIIISHDKGEEFQTMFDRILQVEMVAEFTQMKEVAF